MKRDITDKKSINENMFSNLSIKIIIGVLFIVLTLYLLGLVSISAAENLFPDFDTAYYWFEQFTTAGKEALGSVVAVFIFEFFSMCFKIKGVT